MTRDLDYCKAILVKVSFDPKLFKKELNKAFALLGAKERIELEYWVRGFVKDKQALRSTLSSNSGAFTLG